MEASPIPPAFYFALFVGAFAVVVWGMSLVFRSRSIGPNADREDSD